MHGPETSPPHSNGRGYQRTRIPSDFVWRPRLVERLQATPAAPRLTLVSAPAGYGKTVLLAGWLRETGAPAAWVALEDPHNDLPAFCRRLESAVQDVYPECCRQGLPPDAPRSFSPDEQVERMAAELERLPGPLVLVLDDYHHVREESTHRFIRQLIERMPENLILVLATREDPPLPLARLRAANALVEIRARQLKFTRCETREFLAGALAVRPSETVVAALDERAEGWIAGLRLAAIALRDHDDPEGFARAFHGTTPCVMTYLLDEVLSRLPSAAQELLLLTSVLDRFCPDLCAAVLDADGTDVAGLLAQMESGNVLLGAGKQDPDWHCIHTLFRDVLRQRLTATRPAAEIATLHRRASDWLGSHGEVEAAVRHASAAGDTEAAAALVECHALEALDQERWGDVQQWLSLLPSPVEEARPLLLLAGAAAGGGWFRLGGLGDALDRAEARLGAEQPDTAPLFGLLAALRSQEAYLSREPARAVQEARQALSRLPRAWTFARGTASFYLALSLQAQGAGAEALRVLDAAADPQGNPPPGYLARIHLARAHVYRREGKLGAFGHAARSALRHAAAARRQTTEAWAHCWLGHACYERDALQEAARHFRAALQLRPAAQVMALHDSLDGLTFCCQALGDPDQATEALETASKLADDVGPPYAAGLAQSCGVRLALFQGRRGEAQRQLAVAECGDPCEPEIWFELPALTRARVLLAGRSEPESLEAAALLSACLEETDAEHDAWRALHILPLLAVAQDALELRREADEALSRALATAGADGFLRCFLDAGPRVVPILERLAPPGPVAAAAVARVLAAFAACGFGGSEGAERESKPDPILEPLTRREVEVLGLLARRFTDREIADLLFISTFTVKRHAASIYGKLHVEGRREAVTRAQDLGLISAD